MGTLTEAVLGGAFAGGASSNQLATFGGKAEGDVESLRVLVAEDNMVNQQIALRLLVRRGHRVVVVDNGLQALQALESESFDMVLMDIQMPEMDGVEATTAIRVREKATGEHIPIMAVTAHAMKGDRDRYLAAGMDAYLSKPFRNQELCSAVEQLAKASARRRSEDCGTRGGQDSVTPKSDDAPCPSATNQVFDRNAALDCVEGDTGLLGEMIDAFLSGLPALQDETRRAASSGDPEATATAAGKLTGCLASLGAAEACRAASRLHDNSRLGNPTGIKESAAVLEAALERLKPELHHWIESAVDPAW